MSWKNPGDRRAYRRRKYAEMRDAGEAREWGKIPAICPVCSKTREISKNQHGITKLPKKDGMVIRRCRSCSKRKDYAPWFDKDHVRDYQMLRRQKLKVRAIEYLGNYCMSCGLAYDGDNSYAFDFHHRDPQAKDFLPASRNRAWKKVQAELDKCDLLCAICHRKLHFESSRRAGMSGQ
jgi:hypothetical protein